jgi:hypothetical protein
MINGRGTMNGSVTAKNEEAALPLSR